MITKYSWPASKQLHVWMEIPINNSGSFSKQNQLVEEELLMTVSKALPFSGPQDSALSLHIAENEDEAMES